MWETLLDECSTFVCVCVCGGGGGGGIIRYVEATQGACMSLGNWGGGGVDVEVIGESGHGADEGCGSRGWYLVIKGGDVGSQEEIGRKRGRLRLYWGVEVGGEEQCQGDI